MPTKDLSKLIEKLNHEKKNAIKNGIYHLIQIKFSYNSNRIEGSSLTYEQTAHIFDKSAQNTWCYLVYVSLYFLFFRFCWSL